MFPGLRAKQGQRHMKKPSPIHLQVLTTINRRDLHLIYKLGPELIRLIEAGGVKLLLSCWKVQGDIIELYNYWDLQCDANELFRLELKIPDEPAYAKFDRLIIREDKDLVVPVNNLPVLTRDPPPKPDERFVYMRASYQVATKDLPEFIAQIEAAEAPMAHENGWMFLGTYFGLTGRANEVVQLWAIPERSVAFAEQRLSSADWQQLVYEPPVYEVLEPTPTDPFLGRRANAPAPVAAVGTAKAGAGMIRLPLPPHGPPPSPSGPPTETHVPKPKRPRGV